MNYFNIQPITISINNPFDFKTITAIKWNAAYVPRGLYESSIFKCALLDQKSSGCILLGFTNTTNNN